MSTDSAAEERGPQWYRRRTEITDTAAALFAQQGYAATGVAELCQAVGLGRGSLYYYIGSKENLLILIHERVMVRLLATAAEVAQLDAPPPERLRLLGIELIRMITDFPDHVWVFLHEWHSLTGERQGRFRSKRANYESILEGVLQEGMEQGYFQVRDVRITVLAWLNLHNYTYIWYRRGGPYSPLQLANEYFEIFTAGIDASQGYNRHDSLTADRIDTKTSLSPDPPVRGH